MRVDFNIMHGTPRNHPALRPMMAAALDALPLVGGIVGEFEKGVTLIVSGQPDDSVLHVQAQVLANDSEEAFRLIKSIYMAARGEEKRGVFIRVMPETDTQTDFNFECTYHKGYVRFCVLNEPGDEKRSRDQITIDGGGFTVMPKG